MIKTRKSNLISNVFLCFGLLCVCISFVIPNEFFSMLKMNFFQIISYNNNVLFYFLSLLLLPLVLAFSWLGKSKYAFAFSLIFLITQIFPDIYYSVIRFFRQVFILNIVLVGLAILNDYLFESKKINTILGKLSISIFVLLLLVFYILPNIFLFPQDPQLFVIFLITTFYLFKAFKYFHFQVVHNFTLVYYVFSFCLMFFLMNCNYKATGDVLSVNWEITSIWNHCSSYIIDTIGSIAISYSMLLKFHLRYHTFCWRSSPAE